MNRAKQGGSIGLVAALVAVSSLAGAAEVFLSPQCEADIGYDSNRYRTEDAAGSSFLAVRPGLEVNVFVSETAEMNGFAFHRRSEFLREGFAHTELSGGTIGIRHIGGAWVAGVSLSGFAFRDAAVPDNDVTQMSVSPNITYTHITGTRYSLAATVGGYRHTAASAPDETEANGRFWSLRPRCRWTAFLPISLWAELFLEASSSDEESEEYDGYGFSVGLDYSPSGPLSAALSFHYGAYRLSNTSGSRNGSFSGTFSLSYRAASWAEIHADTRGGTFWNQDIGLNYDELQLGVGLRLIYDLEVGS